MGLLDWLTGGIGADEERVDREFYALVREAEDLIIKWRQLVDARDERRAIAFAPRFDSRLQEIHDFTFFHERPLLRLGGKDMVVNFRIAIGYYQMAAKRYPSSSYVKNANNGTRHWQAAVDAMQARTSRRG